MQEKQLNIYISYSKNNTNKIALSNISAILVKKGYNVTYWIETQEYTTSKLDNADIVLFIGKSEEFYTGDSKDFHEYLSKGQFTELERSIKNDKNILFYDAILGGNLQEQSIAVRELSENHSGPFVLNSNDWKGKYGKVVSTRVYRVIFANDIQVYKNLWFGTISNSQNYNLLLLL